MILTISSYSTESCRVRESSSKTTKECEFPFKFEGETHNSCIDFLEIKDGQKIPTQDGSHWCSTKVNGSDREHVRGGGFFGDCPTSCLPLQEQGKKYSIWYSNATTQWVELESNETLSNIDRTFAGWYGMLQRPQNIIAGNPIK